MRDYKVGNVIKVKVSGITKYGIFVKVDKLYSGLIHISEVSNEFVKDINDYVKKDEYIYAQILSIDVINKQMKLSIKDINFKNNGELRDYEEEARGFIPLKQALPKWEEEILNILEKNKKDN